MNIRGNIKISLGRSFLILVNLGKIFISNIYLLITISKFLRKYACIAARKSKVRQ